MSRDNRPHARRRAIDRRIGARALSRREHPAGPTEAPGDRAQLVAPALRSIDVRDADFGASDSRLERADRKLQPPLCVREECLRHVETSTFYLNLHMTSLPGARARHARRTHRGLCARETSLMSAC